MTFRHVDATFPKYFIRTYGPQAGDFVKPMKLMKLVRKDICEIFAGTL